MTGKIQLYTGNGKGKTTASLGLALRAAGAGYKVFILQFMKGQKYSELNSLKILSEFITIEQSGLTCFIRNKATAKDIEIARKGLQKAGEVLVAGQYQVVILDEICVALQYELFSIHEVISILQNRADHVEVILTGRNAPKELIDLADLVTEMKEIKHYYNTEKLFARKGIEM